MPSGQPLETDGPLTPPDGTSRNVAPSDQDLLSYLTVAERVTGFVCARSRLSADEAADFRSHVKLKLLENDHAILRKFAGRSSIASYLSVVIRRLLLDYRTAAWGKWRPSVEAKRQGETAVLLERLLTRDGYSVDEAYEVLTTNHRVAITRGALERLVALLPIRLKTKDEGGDSLNFVASSDRDPEETLEARTRAQARGRITDLLQLARAGLPLEDQLLLTLRYEDGRSVAEIGHVLAQDDKSLYRRFERLLRQLRVKLESQGVTGSEIAEVFDPPFFFEDIGEEPPSCPSIQTGAEK